MKNKNQLNPNSSDSCRQDIVVLSPLCASFKKHCRVSPNSGGLRGKVTGFSADSRRRLIRFLLSLETPPELMITLTYPEKWPDDAKQWKRHLDNFRRELSRWWPSSWWVWKLEFQKRGAPHFHLLGGGVDINRLFCFRLWVSSVWYRIVGSGDQKHLKAGTGVDVLSDQKMVISYVCKYVSKVEKDEAGGWVGRFWGKINKDRMPSSVEVVVELRRGEFNQVRRLVRRYIKAVGRRLKGKRKKRARRPFWKTVGKLQSWAFYGSWLIVYKVLTWVIGSGVIYHIRGDSLKLLI